MYLVFSYNLPAIKIIYYGNIEDSNILLVAEETISIIVSKVSVGNSVLNSVQFWSI